MASSDVVETAQTEVNPAVRFESTTDRFAQEKL
jgi:hypothetical protein